MGMPLYMEPNFEDLSCKMIFGQQPPRFEDDPVNGQPCFKQCAPLHFCVCHKCAVCIAAEWNLSAVTQDDQTSQRLATSSLPA